MPNGKVQPEFEERLKTMGTWLKTYGESIYGTEAGYLKPQEWGSITKKGDRMYVHVLNAKSNQIVLPQFPNKKIRKAYLLKDNTAIPTKLIKGELTFTVNASSEEDRVIVLESQ